MEMGWAMPKVVAEQLCQAVEPLAVETAERAFAIEQQEREPSKLDRAALLKRVFGIEILRGARCGAAMRLVAFRSRDTIRETLKGGG